MTDVATAIIAASPNCFLDYNTLVAFWEFSTLGTRHVEVRAGEVKRVDG